MSYPGGYQTVDLHGIEFTNARATTITDSKIAEILRQTNKPVYFYDAVIDGIATNVVADIRTNVAGIDGKVYGFIGPNSAFFNVSTNGDKVTFTPA